jgi:hypothetical protein
MLYLFILFIYQAVQYFHIFLLPFNNYIIFSLQLLLSFQSSSVNTIFFCYLRLVIHFKLSDLSSEAKNVLAGQRIHLVL